MIKITRLEHLELIPEKEIVPYISNLLKHILEEYKDYSPNGSLETIGAIFFITSKKDLENHLDFGLSVPIDKARFEWIEKTTYNGYVDGCIVLDNDRAINIIGKQEYFTDYMED